MSENHIVILCTVPGHGVGEMIARALIDEKLAACVNLFLGVTSFYRWEGEIKEDQEGLLLIKTRAERFEDVKKCIEVRHPYDVPEVIALPVTAGSESYLKWLTENSK